MEVVSPAKQLQKQKFCNLLGHKSAGWTLNSSSHLRFQATTIAKFDCIYVQMMTEQKTEDWS